MENGLDINHYDAIFRRKSFHSFKGIDGGRITDEELDGIAKVFGGFARLCPEIRTAIRAVPAGMLKRGAEHCLLIYSEKKDNYLMNAGYIGEQLDLYLAERGIGALWFGFGIPDRREWNGLSFVVMILIRRVEDTARFRSGASGAKRKAAAEIWEGDDWGLADAARLAPSACNSQPWRVKSDGGRLSVFRFKKPGRVGLMPAPAALYFNRIDMGIFLCFLELCMAKKGIAFERELFVDDGRERELTKVAEYSVSLPAL